MLSCFFLREKASLKFELIIFEVSDIHALPHQAGVWGDA